MLNRDILVSQRFRLIFGIHQYFIQILSDINLSSLNLRTFADSSLDLRQKYIAVYLHFLDQFLDQTILYRQHPIK